MQSEAETYRAGPGPAAEGESQRVHLLLSAGGVRCLSYIGALHQLQRAGYEAATVSTCSAGTFIGALYCCGLGPSELREAVLDFYAKELAGHARWKLLRRLWSLRAWPYALHERSGLAETFAKNLSDAGLEPDPQLGDLRPPLSTAAMDVVGQRLLVYSSGTNPDMRVGELLNIAVALPFLYPPHRRQGRELFDAALVSHSPVWLATGQREDLPIVVLRAPAPRPPQTARRLTAWADDILKSCAVTRDTLLLERLPQVSVCDIQTGLPSLEFDLSRNEIERLIECGRRAVADMIERQIEPSVLPTGHPDDDRAEHGAASLYGRHLERLASLRISTVFLSHAREDHRWVQRLRQYLGELLADPDVSVWDDSYIKPGTLWDAAIENAVTRARVAVLFISQHFVASQYIAERELPLLRERSSAGLVRVLWVSLDGTAPPAPERAIQGFGCPERPLEAMDEAAADRTLAELARRIEEEYRNQQVDRGSHSADSPPMPSGAPAIHR